MWRKPVYFIGEILYTLLYRLQLNELAKLYGVYDRKETKADRIRRLSDLPEADDIIFNEIAIERYGSVEDMKNAFNKLPEKRKRGRPKKTA